jgi:nucleotide-binding universal stress UspA family protein
MFKKIVVGADDSSTASEAVQMAMRLAQLSGAELHIVTAYKPERAKPPRQQGLPEELRYSLDTHPADRLLERLAAMARSASLKPIVHAAAAEPAEALTTIASKEDADLIVVGNKGMKGVRRVLGSVPNDVAHRAPCSVLIVDTTG